MDITQATRLVRSMVCEWGMTDKLGAVAYDERTDSGLYLGMPSSHEKSYSEATAEAIDKEVRVILDEAHVRAKEIIEANRQQVQLMTEMLMEFETLDREDVLEIMNDEFDSEKKKQRLKNIQDLQRKTPPPPPPEKTSDNEIPPIPENTAPQKI
jgi:cell division protease FtsH